MADQHALVIVPTFNERDAIAEVARRLFAAAPEGVELLVVDDASPDGTAEVVEALQAGPHPVHLMSRARKLGLGTAYVAAFRWALERGYWAVVEMDADLSHDPADVPRLLAALADADLAIGSRYVAGGSIPNWGLFRRALSAGGNLYARRCLGFDVRDSTSGLRAYRAELLRALGTERVRSEGYAFQIEMTRKVARAGARIVELPITFSERARDRSKLSRAIIVEALVRVTLWGVHDLVGRARGAARIRSAEPARDR